MIQFSTSGYQTSHTKLKYSIYEILWVPTDDWRKTKAEDQKVKPLKNTGCAQNAITVLKMGWISEQNWKDCELQQHYSSNNEDNVSEITRRGTIRNRWKSLRKAE